MKLHHPTNRYERLRVKEKKEHTLKNRNESLKKAKELLEIKELDHELREEISV